MGLNMSKLSPEHAALLPAPGAADTAYFLDLSSLAAAQDDEAPNAGAVS
jgi:hypothetical protein